MKSLRQMAEQILRLLAGGDIPSDFEIKEGEIILAIGQERDKLVRLRKFEDEKMGSEYAISPSFLSIYNSVEIKKDETRDLYYSELPGKPMSLTRDEGVWEISFTQGDWDSFKRIPTGSTSLFNGLEASNLEGHIGYTREGEKIYYRGMPKDLSSNKVLMKLVLDSGSVDPNDPLPMPSDMEADVINLVLRRFMPSVTKPDDKLNDSNDTEG